MSDGTPSGSPLDKISDLAKRARGSIGEMPNINLGNMSIGSPLSDKSFFDESITPAKLRDLLDKKSYDSAAGTAERIRGMKWLLAQMSTGQNVIQFFPSVVKNVIVKNVELKKLVYMYLTHYADTNEEIRQIALLSINSFQKDLASPNQLIRALALRVLTSIRIREISAIQISSLTKAAGDSSPYVRKTCAHALSKLYNLDHDQKEDLVPILTKLLSDRSTIVLGSAVAAFCEICSDRDDLIHPHYRKLCSRLADLDEWSQITVMRLLTRYSRTQFLNPRIDLNTGEECDVPPPSETYDSIAAPIVGVSNFGGTKHYASAPQQKSELEIAMEKGTKGFYSDEEESTKPAVDKKKKKKKKEKKEKKAKKKKEQGEDKSGEQSGEQPGEQLGEQPSKKLEPAQAPAPAKEEVLANVDEPVKVAPADDNQMDGAADDEGEGGVGDGDNFLEDTVEEVEEPAKKKEIKLRGVTDDDHRKLLAASLPLLQSRNAGVVLAVASLHWNIGSRKHNTLSKIVKALCRNARGRPEVQAILMQHIVTFATERPELFRPYLADFLVHVTTDSAIVRSSKLQMLTILADEGNVQSILAELTVYAKCSDVMFAREVVQAVGRLACQFPGAYPQVMRGMTALVVHPDCSPELIGECILIIRMLAQRYRDKDMEEEKVREEEMKQLLEEAAKAEAEGGGEEEDSESDSESEPEEAPEEEAEGSTPKSDRKKEKEAKKKAKKAAKKEKKKAKKAAKKEKKKAKRARRAKIKIMHEKSLQDPVILLARMLDQVKVPEARASIIWIIGEFQYKSTLYQMAPDTLRRLAISFAKEPSEVKLQVANLAVKLLLQREGKYDKFDLLQHLVTYVLELGSYYEKKFKRQIPTINKTIQILKNKINEKKY